MSCLNKVQYEIRLHITVHYHSHSDTTFAMHRLNLSDRNSTTTIRQPESLTTVSACKRLKSVTSVHSRFLCSHYTYRNPFRLPFAFCCLQYSVQSHSARLCMPFYSFQWFCFLQKNVEVILRGSPLMHRNTSVAWMKVVVIYIRQGVLE